MKIATAPVNWNNPDISDYRPFTAYGPMMDEMVEAGYTATEWGPGMPDDPAVVRAECAARGLDMVGAFVRLGYRDRDAWDEADAAALAIAERVKAAGGSILVAAELGDDRRDAEAGHVDESRGLTDEQWRNLADGLAHLADLLEPMGLRVVLHNHVGTYVETAAETKRFLDETDPAKVGWCLDVGHLKYGGGDTLDFLPEYGDRVEHVHLKDVDADVLARAQAESLSFGDALRAYIFPDLGDGVVPIAQIVADLQARGYDGWYVLEQDTSRKEPKDAAAANLAFVQGLQG